MPEGGISRSILKTVGLLVSGAGMLAFVAVPFRAHDDPLGDPGGFLSQLLPFGSSLYGGVPGLSWLFLAILALLLLAAALIVHTLLTGIASYISRSRVGISVLQTELCLEIEDHAMTRARVRREQLFHANRRNVSAYHFEHRATASGGSIDPASITMTSIIDHDNVTDHLIKSRGIGKQIDTIELFKRPLPTSFFATYLPNSVVLFLHERMKMFRKTIVHRTGEMLYNNEYNIPEPIFQLASVRYPVTNVRMKVVFPEQAAPPADRIDCFLIEENTVKKITPARVGDQGRVTYTIDLRSFYQAKLRIQWRNHPVPPSPTPGWPG